MKNPNCGNERCSFPDGEVRVLPTGGDSNAILCRTCFEHEIRWRRGCNEEVGSERYKTPAWEDLTIYPASETSYARLPEHMRKAARLYVEQGIEPGGFLLAVLSNDLKGAFGRGDAINIQNMNSWAIWLHSECPSMAQGSEQKVNDWIARGGLAGNRLVK